MVEWRPQGIPPARGDAPDQSIEQYRRVIEMS
jgi:hypothetical protein